MQIQDLERIRFVTRHYGELQGLQLVAGGLMLLGFAFTDATLHSFLLAVALTLALLGGSIVLQLSSSSYYTRTFGKVRKRGARPLQANEPLAVVLLVAFVLFVLLFCAMLALNPDGVNAFLVNSFWRIMCLVLGGVFVGTWISRECRLSQFHHLALGVLLLSLATTGRMTFLVPPFTTVGSAQLLCGMAAIVAGLLDHWQLVHTLGPPSAAFLAEKDAEPVETQR